jgi:DNA-binding response OmpR family regulator
LIGREPDLSLTQKLSEVRRTWPDSVILVVLEKSCDAQCLRIVRAGADDCLSLQDAQVGLAHSLVQASDRRQSLYVVKGSLELLGRTLAEGHSPKILARMHEAVNQMTLCSRLFQQLGKTSGWRPERTDLNEIMRDLSNLLRSLLGSDCELCMVYEEELAPVSFDRVVVERLLLGLTQMLGQTSRHRRLILRTRALSVIAAQALSNGTLEPGDYTGLTILVTGPDFGMELRAGLAQLPSGQLWDFESDPRQCAQLHLYWRNQSVEMKHANRLLQVPPLGETILLVEDEDEVRQLARQTLEAMGYTVLEAREPREATMLTELHPGSIHLLVMDILLPKMDGFELADRLLKLRPQARVLYLSGTDVRPRENVILVRKPFSAEQLLMRVREALNTPLPAVTEPLDEMWDYSHFHN